MALPVLLRRRERTMNPFQLARNDFDKMISQVIGNAMLSEEGDGGPLSALAGYGVDIRETPDHYYAEVDLPGFKRDEIDVSLEGGTLTITAEHQEEMTGPAQQSGGGGKQKGSQSPQNETYLLRERRIQRFVRSFTLPSDVDDQSVEAKLEDGVLKITLKKREESKAKHVQVS
jgi:HSP20 family protein